ncbi:MAG: DUF5106 domain-containing protein [Bacteroidota bacterium]|nr:DUF5106 domain-containing protein [Bacteroidota bacterium]
MVKKLIFTAFVCLIFLNLYSQKSTYSIQFRIEGLEDSVLYLASYYGDKNTLADTAIGKKGQYTFKGKGLLPGGVYFLVSQNKAKMIEFIVDKEQDFTIITDTSEMVLNARIKGSGENKIFFDYVRFTESFHEKAKQLNAELKEPDISEPAKMDKLEQLSNINDSINRYKASLLREHPDHLISVIFRTLQQPQIPDTLNSQDPDFKRIQYQIYKDNYWNNISLQDPRILRTPVFYDKLSVFFNKIVYQHPDSIMKEIDEVLSRTDTSDIVFNYLIWHFIEQYDQEEVMGMDKVFVHLANQYFGDSTRVNTSKSVIEKIRKRAEKVEPLLIGKQAPNLILLDTANTFTSFLNIQSDYILLFFYDYDCGVCKQEINIMKPLIDSIAFKVEVFAVCTDTNLLKWKEKIRQYKIQDWVNVNATRSITANYHDLYDIYATPMIYVLNRKREIIAKKISANQLYQFLKYYDSKNR